MFGRIAHYFFAFSTTILVLGACSVSSEPSETKSDAELFGAPPLLTPSAVRDAVRAEPATTALVARLSSLGCSVDVDSAQTGEWQDHYLPFFAGTYRWQTLQGEGRCSDAQQRAGLLALTSDDGKQTSVVAYHATVTSEGTTISVLRFEEGAVVAHKVDQAFVQELNGNLQRVYKQGYDAAARRGVLGLNHLIATAKGLTPAAMPKTQPQQIAGYQGAEQQSGWRACGAAFIGALFAPGQSCCDCQNSMKTCLREVSLYENETVAALAMAPQITNELLGTSASSPTDDSQWFDPSLVGPSQAAQTAAPSAAKFGQQQEVETFLKEMAGVVQRGGMTPAYLQSLVENAYMQGSVLVLQFKNLPGAINIESYSQNPTDFGRQLVTFVFRGGYSKMLTDTLQWSSTNARYFWEAVEESPAFRAENLGKVLQAVKQQAVANAAQAVGACAQGQVAGSINAQTCSFGVGGLIAALQAFLAEAAVATAYVTGAILASTAIVITAMAATQPLRRAASGVDKNGSSSADEDACSAPWVGACTTPACSVGFKSKPADGAIGGGPTALGGYCKWSKQIWHIEYKNGMPEEVIDWFKVDSGYECYCPYDAAAFTQIPCVQDAACHFDCNKKSMLGPTPVQGIPGA